MSHNISALLGWILEICRGKNGRFASVPTIWGTPGKSSMYIVMSNSTVIQFVQRLMNHLKQIYILPDDSRVYRIDATFCSYLDIHRITVLLKFVNFGGNSLTSPEKFKNLYPMLEGQIYTHAMVQFSRKWRHVYLTSLCLQSDIFAEFGNHVIYMCTVFAPNKHLPGDRQMV